MCLTLLGGRGGSRPSQTCLTFGQIFFSRRPLKARGFKFWLQIDLSSDPIFYFMVYGDEQTFFLIFFSLRKISSALLFVNSFTQASQELSSSFKLESQLKINCCLECFWLTSHIVYRWVFSMSYCSRMFSRIFHRCFLVVIGQTHNF